MTIDRQVVAERVRALRATLPQDGDLLTGLQQVTEATRSVVGVDGTGLTLAHEDGQPRWVAVSDAAMELLEQVQHDFGEGRACWRMPRTGWWRWRTCAASGCGSGSPRWLPSCVCMGC
jgi:hypothetical protein